MSGNMASRLSVAAGAPGLMLNQGPELRELLARIAQGFLLGHVQNTELDRQPALK